MNIQGKNIVDRNSNRYEDTRTGLCLACFEVSQEVAVAGEEYMI